MSEKNYSSMKDSDRVEFVNEQGTVYFARRDNLQQEINQKISQEELECNCFTLEESREMLLEKIHRHFHCS